MSTARKSYPPPMPALLERLERWLRVHRPEYYDSLRSGVTERDLTLLERTLGRNLPAGFRELYRWHDGQEPDCTLGLQYNQMFMPLGNVRMVCAALAQLFDGGEFPEKNWWSKSWVPFLDNGDGDHLCVDLDGAFAGVPGQVLNFYHDWECRNIEYPSMEKWMSTFVQGLEAGLWSQEEEGFKPRDDEQVRAIRSRVALGYPKECMAGGPGGPAVHGW